MVEDGRVSKIERAATVLGDNVRMSIARVGKPLSRTELPWMKGNLLLINPFAGCCWDLVSAVLEFLVIRTGWMMMLKKVWGFLCWCRFKGILVYFKNRFLRHLISKMHIHKKLCSLFPPLSEAVVTSTLHFTKEMRMANTDCSSDSTSWCHNWQIHLTIVFFCVSTFLIRSIS